MRTPKEPPKLIRALDRGLTVLEHLSRKGPSTLADLRASTGLSNATLLRIIATMQARNWVRRALVEGRYALTNRASALLGAGRMAHPLAEAAAPVMQRLADGPDGWQTDLAVPVAPGAIELVESTRRRGPMAPQRAPYGLRPSMVFSAHGRALLAFCGPGDSTLHIDAIRLSGTRDERRWLDDGRLDRVLAETRKCGLGLREAAFWAEPVDYGPEMSAAARPVMQGGRVVATLSVLWLAETLSYPDFLTSAGPARLTAAVTEIETAIAGLPPSTALPGVRDKAV